MPLYDEIQHYHWAMWLLLAASVGATVGALLAPAVAGQTVPISAWGTLGATWLLLAGVCLLLLRQHITVVPGAALIAFGFIELWRKRIDLAQVDTMEAVRFNPLTDFGGWGIKRGRGGVWCYNVRGNTGVHLRGPRINLVIGTAYPQALLEALLAAKGQQTR